MKENTKIRSGRYFAFVGVAALANVIIFLIGQAIGATYDVKAQMPVNVGIVVGLTVVQLSIGFVLAWLTARFAPKIYGGLIWFGFAFAILSAPGGWLLSGDTATGISLGLMHFTGAFAWYFGVKKS